MSPLPTLISLFHSKFVRRADARTEAAAPVTMATLPARVESATGTPVPSSLPLSSVRPLAGHPPREEKTNASMSTTVLCFARCGGRLRFEMISNGVCQIDIIGWQARFHMKWIDR